jgi:DNA end-binding protein Ku
MHFADELADTSKLDIPKKVEVGKREMNMAGALIESMSSKWEPDKYHDEYKEKLMDVIEDKIEHGGVAVEHKPKKGPKPTKVIDLVKVLQKSLEETGGTGHGKKAAAKHHRHQSHRHKKAA